MVGSRGRGGGEMEVKGGGEGGRGMVRGTGWGTGDPPIGKVHDDDALEYPKGFIRWAPMHSIVPGQIVIAGLPDCHRHSHVGEDEHGDQVQQVNEPQSVHGRNLGHKHADDSHDDDHLCQCESLPAQQCVHSLQCNDRYQESCTYGLGTCTCMIIFVRVRVSAPNSLKQTSSSDDPNLNESHRHADSLMFPV